MADWITRKRTTINPRTGRKFDRPRTIYSNHFGRLRATERLSKRQITAAVDGEQTEEI